MRTGGIGTTAHDGEVDLLVTFVDQQRAQVAGHFGLRASDQADLSCLQYRRHPIGSGTGRAQGLDLRRVLDGPDGRGDCRRLDPHPIGQSTLEGEHRGGPRAVGYGQTEPTAGSRGWAYQHREDQIDGILRVVPRHGDEQITGGSDPRRLQRRDHQDRLPLGPQHQHGQTFERHGPVPGQPRKVGTMGQEQCIHVQGPHPFANPTDPFVARLTGAVGKSAHRALTG